MRRIGDALDIAWRELVAPDWPQLRAICERDVVHRAGRSVVYERTALGDALAGGSSSLD